MKSACVGVLSIIEFHLLLVAILLTDYLIIRGLFNDDATWLKTTEMRRYPDIYLGGLGKLKAILYQDSCRLGQHSYHRLLSSEQKSRAGLAKFNPQRAT